MSERYERKLWERIRVEYNNPVETPRDEMWTEIESRISSREVIDLDSRRRDPEAKVAPWAGIRPVAGWSVAAAALLVLGMGIGRMSAPVPDVADGPGVASPRTSTAGNQLAARAHLGRTEALLTMVRADARDGRVDPAVGQWADDLLAQTRLLLDRTDGVEPDLRNLLLDLELVLAQVAGMAESDPNDDRARTEIELTLKTLDQGEVLPRIQARIPPGMVGA